MAHVKIWIHAVWGTKNHERILTKEIRRQLFEHIRVNARAKGIHIDIINGDMDHVHCLLALNADLSIAKTIQLIKGESSHWANAMKLIKPKLSWADEYFAVSVSESLVYKVRGYIKTQEEHHKRKAFRDEFTEFIRKYGFENQG